MKAAAVPVGMSWMWTSGYNGHIRRATYGDAPLGFPIIFAKSGEYADPPHPLRLLRARRERPRRRAAEQRG